jgi:excisionase family DNA binding protein
MTTNTPTPPQLLTRSEAAEILRCSRRHIGTLIASGMLPAATIATRTLIARRDVDAYIARQTVRAEVAA